MGFHDAPEAVFEAVRGPGRSAIPGWSSVAVVNFMVFCGLRNVVCVT